MVVLAIQKITNPHTKRIVKKKKSFLENNCTETNIKFQDNYDYTKPMVF